MQEPELAAAGTGARKFARILSEIGTKGDLPAGAEIIQQLQTAIRKEDCNALEVVRIILKDTALSSKVLRVVNSSFYRRTGNSVSTVTGAIVLLGFQTIRDLSASLLIIDHFSRKGGGQHIREGLRRSLYCGLLSQTLSGQVGCSAPEEAYLLGLVANFPHLWLAAHYPHEFDKAVRLQREENISLEHALTRVVGGAPGDIAAAALGNWNFPSRYLDYFSNPPATDRESIDTPSAKLSAIVNISADYIARTTEAGTEGGRQVIRRFQDLFSLEPGVFLEAARRANTEFREQASLNGLPISPVLDDRLLEAMLSSEHDTNKTVAAVRTDNDPDGGDGPGSQDREELLVANPVEVEEAMEVPSGVAELEPCVPPSLERNAATALGIVADITGSILDRNSITETLSMVLEGVGRIGRFDVVFLALMNAKRDRIVGRLGYGEGVQEHLGSLSVSLGENNGMIAETVSRQLPIIAAHASAAALVPQGAPVPQIPGRSFISHPLILSGKVLGVLVAARTEGPTTTEDDSPVLRLFCNQACLALERSVY